jgi:peroxiredoxin
MYKIGIEGNNKIIDPKSLIISGDVHEMYKRYCKSKGINISFNTEKLMLDFLTANGVKVPKK